MNNSLLLSLLLLFSSIILPAQDCPEKQNFERILKNETAIESLLSVNNFPVAMDSARQGLIFAESIGYHDGMVQSNCYLAKCFYSLHEYESALMFAQQAIDLLKKHPKTISPYLKALANFEYGATQIAMYNVREGIDSLMAVLNILGTPDPLIKMDFWNLPCLQESVYAYKIQQEAGLQYIIPLMKGHTASHLAYGMDLLLESNQAVFYHEYAAKQYQNASTIFPLINLNQDQSNALIMAFGLSVTDYTESQFDRQRKDQNFQKALDLLKNSPNPEVSLSLGYYFRSVRFFFQKTDAQSASNDIEQAITFIHKADTMVCFTSLGVYPHQFEAFLLTNKALILVEKGDKVQSRELIPKVINILNSHANSNPSFHFLEATIYHNLALISLEIGNIENVHQFVEKSWRLMVPDIPMNSVLKDSGLYLSPSQLKISPLIPVGLLIMKIYPEFNHQMNSQTPNTDQLKKILNSLLVCLDLYDKQYSLYTPIEKNPMLKTKDVLNLHSLAGSTYVKAFLVAKKLFDLTGDKQYIELAFNTVERNKSYLLRKGLNNLEQFRGLPNHILEQKRNFTAQITRLENQIIIARSKQDSTTEKKCLEQLVSSFGELNSFINMLSENYGNYTNTVHEEKMVDLSELQKKLDDSTAIVQYIIDSDQSGYAMVIRNKSIGFSHKLNADNQWTETICKMNNAILNDEFIEKPQLVSDYIKTASQLYGTIIKPLEGDLNGIKRLIIMPDGILHSLNFELLLTEPLNIKDNPAPINNIADLQYLLRKYVVSYAPSGTIFNRIFLSSSHHETINPKLGYVGFEPDYQSWNNYIIDHTTLESDPVLGTFISNKNFDGFNEVEQIKDNIFQFDSKIWSREAATENVFKDMVEQHRIGILHFSGHSLLQPNLPLETKLLFSYQEGKVSDNYLTVAELYNMSMNVDLVILSSCNSGVSSEIQVREGFASLARAFVFAGGRNILMSQWEVEAGRNQEIIISFCKYVKAGMPFDVALNQAKIDFLSDPNRALTDCVPKIWAPLMQMGVGNFSVGN